MVRRFLAPAAALVGLLAAAAPAQAVDGTQLTQALTAGTATFGPKSSVLVRDLTTDTTLYAKRETLALSPASNEKLFTTASALLKWGPDATLVTKVKVNPALGPDASGTVNGSVSLVGAGDPGLNDDAMRDLASDLYRAGVRKITGAVLGDESYFDTRRGDYDTGYGPDTEELGGWLSALAWGHGRVGTHGPAATAAQRLRYFLGLAKVKVVGGYRAEVRANATRTLASVPSAPVRDLIASTLIPSDNFYAEMLTKGLGARFGGAGTSAAGLVVERGVLDALGVHPTIVDGSGLSPVDHTSTTTIMTLLTAMAKNEYGVIWRGAMATPGRTGTLAARMRGTVAVSRCHAKTGTLHDVSALSGYCKVPSGHLIAFSFLENAISPLPVKAREDKLVPVIASYEPPVR